MPAITALRTSRSSNGGRLVSIETARQPPPGSAESWGLSFLSSVLSWLDGGCRSPDAMLSPVRIRRVATRGVVVAGLELDLVQERRAEVASSL